MTQIMQNTFRLWKTAKLGTSQSVEGLRKALKDNGCRVSNWANDVLNRIVVSHTERESDLVAITVADLGFKDGATREDIYRAAEEFGLELCPPEVGPQLRLQYNNQPICEWLLIGMKPIVGSDITPITFCVGRDDNGCWLSARWCDHKSFWPSDRRWVFILSK